MTKAATQSRLGGAPSTIGVVVLVPATAISLGDFVKRQLLRHARSNPRTTMQLSCLSTTQRDWWHTNYTNSAPVVPAIFRGIGICVGLGLAKNRPQLEAPESV
jgi:hypothetical protein